MLALCFAKSKFHPAGKKKGGEELFQMLGCLFLII